MQKKEWLRINGKSENGEKYEKYEYGGSEIPNHEKFANGRSEIQKY